MSETLRWWLVLELVGTLLLPLCLVLFRRLPDRGYALSKPFGLLLLGYTFWLLSTRNFLPILPNNRNGITGALILLLLLSAFFAWRELDALIDWVSEHWRYIVGVELLFFGVFIIAVWLRQMVGQIAGTEQPMDLMFLQAATKAEHFPPNDPWLSGYTVAYYYGGYLLVAIVGVLAGVPAPIGYNIGVAMIATMTLVGAFGIVYNLVRMREGEPPPRQPAVVHADAPPRAELSRSRQATTRAAPAVELGDVAWKAPAFGLLGAFMLVLMGNLVWLLQFASAYGIGGSGFYNWIDVQGLTADEPKGTWYPSEFFGFFSASRIYPLNNADYRVITEFPMFSFLLGDLHPHVMSLPFVLIVVAIALTLYRSEEPLDITFWLQCPLLLIASALAVGALAFINTWDIATMAFVVILAVAVSNYARVRAFTADLAVQVGSFTVPLVILAVLMYLPFYLDFSSQAGGLVAVHTKDGLTEPGTRVVHAFIFWGPLFAVVLPFVIARLVAMRDRIDATIAGIAIAVPALIVIAWGLFFILTSGSKEKYNDAAGLGAQIGDRGWEWLTVLLLGLALWAALAALWLELTSERRDQAAIFALALAATAMLLIVGTEFFYVDDLFHNRMNTVFKLYYQAWLLLALAGGFAAYEIISRWEYSFPRERVYRYAWGGLAAVLVLSGALYTLGGALNRTRPYDGDRLADPNGQLMGLSYLSPEELAAIDYLNGFSKGQDSVIVEAVGNDYGPSGRISMATGLPAVLGWAGHEDQWRGDTKPRAGRFEDVNNLYLTNDMAEVQQIVNKYGVSFIYVGKLERDTYGAPALEKFRSLPVAFTAGNAELQPDSVVTVYRASAAGEVP